MTKQDLVAKMQEGRAWIPGRRVKIDFGGSEGVVMLDGADEQVTEVASAEALRLVLAAPVLADAVDQPGPFAGFVAGHAGHRHPAGAPAAHPDDGGPADPAPGPGTRRRHRLPGFVAE